ncbi:virulence-associated E family protein [Vibrio sp. HA2012]|uniref:VapE domain-containing protein n=1 Tax=Vibrio sp. HA2012 TaxID=1971595 RepID=UPI000C2C42D9|nr:VapE domain-containing protein [Vibrio sp. HA2012]PJC86010.1 virulence-associated E family protein [Vibrio sp. HA2012]
MNAISTVDKQELVRETTLVFPDTNDYGKPIGTAENLKVLLDSLGITPTQNLMNLELELFSYGEPLGKSYESKRSFLVSECLKAGLPKTIIDDHLTALCEGNPYHPARAYLDGNKWDGKPRLKPLIAAMNAKDLKLAEIVMKRWFVSVVACLYEDRFSSKLVPVLQGGQSFKKTAFISRLANFAEGIFLEGAELNPDNKDSVLSCIKSLIVELGELERTSKNSQGSLKAFVTRSVDSVRPPYARTDIKKNRQTLFIATVNGTEFLRDETGSSRYAVIELDKPVDMDCVNQLLGWEYQNGRVVQTHPEELQQLWLEVKALYEAGESWMLTEAELQLTQEANKIHNFKPNWQVVLEDRFIGVEETSVRNYEWMTATDVCLYCDIAKNNVRAIGKALAAMAKDGHIEKKSGRANKTLYRLPVVSEK